MVPVVVAVAGLLVSPAARAISVSEGADFSNSSGGAVTHALDMGANTFSGVVTTTADGRDYFKVTVPVGMRITQVSKTVTGGGFSGFASFNSETITGVGTAGFTGAFATPYPLPSGTYEGYVNADYSTGASWSMTVTVGAAPNYTVTTTATSITVSDDVGNGDTLAITQPSAGQIKFAASGRTFSVNGGALITGDSGNLSLAGVTSLSVNLGGGVDTVNLGAFAGAFPSFSLNPSGNDDTLNVNGDVTLASNRYFEVFNAATCNVAANCNVIASGTGDIYVDCTRNVTLETGASLETVNGELWVEANQQTSATAGNFTGVILNGAGTMLRSTGTGAVTVKGRGGNDSGGFQIGILVLGGAKILGGTTGVLNVTGTGGASTNFINRGLTVSGAGSAISSIGGAVNVLGTAGPVGSYYGIGVSVLSGEISAGGTGALTVEGVGTGAGGSGFNMGLELSGAGAKVATNGGNLTVIGTAGPGASFGIYLADQSALSTPAGGGNVILQADSIAVDGTSSATTLGPASRMTLQTSTSTARVDLGGADDNTGAPKVLGLTDAELDRITTPELVISSASFASLTISSPISPANAPNLTLNADAGTGSVKPAAGGTDVTLTGTLKLDGPLAVPVTGATADVDFPQLKVAGGVNLNGRSLSLADTTFAGSPYQTFTILDNNDSDAITGTFAGLPQDALMAWPGSATLMARISYTGGTGNDVVLTLVNPLEVTSVSNGTGPGSLREALSVASLLPGASTVTFAPYLSGQTITLAGQITINDTDGVTLDASNLAGGLILSGGNVTRHFTIPAGHQLTLKNLTLTGGNPGGSGGAVFNNGYFTAIRCAFSGNTSSFGGGAIATLDATAIMALDNCTLAENSAIFGGAVWHDQSVAILTQCSVVRNTGSSGTGGIVLGPGEGVFHNTLVADNIGTVDPDLGGLGANLTLFGGNLFSQHEGFYAAVLPPGAPNPGGDFVGTAATPVDARLAPLAAYGGPTQSCALRPGSPAIDRGMVVGGFDVTTDQRGFLRNLDGDSVPGAAPDIGAYEVGTVTNFTAWAWENVPSNDPAQHAPAIDFDGDGHTLLLEYAGQYSATLPDGGNPVAFTRNGAGTQATIGFPIRAGVFDIVYEIERSIDLAGTWTRVASYDNSNGFSPHAAGIAHLSTNGNGVIFTDTFIAGQPRIFYRMKVGAPALP